MSQVRKTSADIEKAILKTVHHLDEGTGSSLADILFSNHLHIIQVQEIMLHLNNAVDKGLLKKLTNGKFKVNESARRRKSRSRNRSSAKPKSRSRSRKRSGSRRSRRSSTGRRRKRFSSGRRRKRSTSWRRRSRRSAKTPEEQE